MSHVDFKKYQMSHIFVTYFPLCPLSNLINVHVPYQSMFQANGVVTEACVALSNLITVHAALSILRPNGHSFSENLLFNYFHNTGKK